VDDKLYIHGSQASRMLRTLVAGGVDACVTVTIIDGLVLARSAFHHSMNYRSVVIFGRATLVEDPEEKRWRRCWRFRNTSFAGAGPMCVSQPKQEMKQTTVLSLPLMEASAKDAHGTAA
jgi:nitroimidazol reductase NimA-like FMN-containing flavoprotein (pyridoxamine 5'-phosphate oxidase superfamily)